MPPGLLISIFPRRTDARSSLRDLVKKGYRRTAVVHRTAAGSIQVTDTFIWLRAAAVVTSAVLFVLAALALRRSEYSATTIGGGLPLPLLLAEAAVVGLIVGYACFRRSLFGIDRKRLDDFVPCLMPGESALFLQASMDALKWSMSVIRDRSESLPAIFVIHPEREHRDATRDLDQPLPEEKIRERAREKATDHRSGVGANGESELLSRIRNEGRLFQEICADLAESCRLEQGSSPVAEWIIDNEFLIARSVRDVRINLPKSFYRELPVLADHPYWNGLPCIYELAKELVRDNESRLGSDGILRFIDSYQSVHTLDIAELWAVPQMLRIALVESVLDLAIRVHNDMRERQMAAVWANRFIAAGRRDPAHIFAVLAELDDRIPDPDPYFCTQLISLLYDQATALAPIEAWLERKLGRSANDAILLEQKRQARDQLLIESAFTSIRQLNQIDWREIFEQLSHVDRVLRAEPADVYGSMDFQTRDLYRGAVKQFADRTGRPETEIARIAVDLAADLGVHVGAVLLGSETGRLESRLGCRQPVARRIRDILRRYHGPFYLGCLMLVFVPMLAGVLRYGFTETGPYVTLGFSLLLLIPVSQIAVEFQNYFITRLLKPRPLPKMDFEKTGIPDEFRTLVVIPTLLAGEEAIRLEAENLEIRFMGNRDDNLRYGLFTDFTDSSREHAEDDSRLLQTAVNAIKELNRRYDTDTFFLFHRERTWSDSEQKYIGWERKRGKLEELNLLLDGTRPESADTLVHAGNPDRLAGTRFIITLDSDTQLPHGTARRLIETLSHPLNRPRLNAQAQIAAGSYTIIQPRVTPSLQSTGKSPFSQLYADAVGIDPYTRVVSDVYQDLTGEGSYHGKGIYDVQAFSRILSGTFPDGLVLSHDLIEGAHVRTALASDIELFDEFPQDYLGYVTRLRRWIRGDWQIAVWILPWVPKKRGGFRRNPISLFNRWKVFDNLRRSLLPAANLSLLVAAWLTSEHAALAAMLLIGVQVLFNPLSQIMTAVTTARGLRNFSPSIHANHLLRALTELAMLPHQAYVTLSSILQAGYRLLVSRRKLLEWTTAYAARTTAVRRRRRFTASLLLASLAAVVIAVVQLRVLPANILMAGPWLALWLFSPFFGWLLTARPRKKKLQELLSQRDILFLRRVTRLTWRFFADFVNDATSWLPPDNYQVSHQDQLAMRTSPTNIGFWMLSTLAAHDAGYLTPDETLEKLERTVETLYRLERYEGHLLNWYDIVTLAPLEPRYVSAVDSGNLLGALWTLQQGLQDQFTGLIIDRRVFRGLHDTGRILLKVIAGEPGREIPTAELSRLLKTLARAPDRTIDQLRLLREAAAETNRITDPILQAAQAESETAYWATALRNEAAAWVKEADLYLGWIERLAEGQEDDMARAAIRNLSEIQDDLHHAPSLHTLSRGMATSLPVLTLIREHAHAESANLAGWADSVVKSFARAQHHAAGYRKRYERLRSKIRQLAGEINLRFLYNPERKLFAIGFNVTSGQMDNSYYDLLASEARFGGFVAIARGDIPMEHWFTMGRPHALVGRHRVLLSWTGTMFEYLMPLVFLRSYRYSLLDKAVRDAVEIQIAYGRNNRVPWGISESAYGDLDFHKTYQYKAFGVPKLGLKRVLEEQLVVAPYACMLAVGVRPRETVRNLRELDRYGMLDECGFFESIDFRRKSQRTGRRGVLIRAYMAHHQGMGLLALTNFLHNNPFQRRFHADPRVRAFEPLLQEKIPTLPPLQLTASRERAPTLLEASSDVPASGTFETPHTSMPKTQIICNGRYDLMITNTGGGTSKWNGREITRWRSDVTNDQWGTFCYLHDLDRGDLWSATYHPVGGDSADYRVEFSLDRAIFRRTMNDIQVETEVIVAPEDDVEIRRMTLINRSDQVRHLNLTSYLELSLAGHVADRAHPAFNKLFIQTEALEGERTLLAYRRPRSEEDPPFFVAHSFPGGRDGSAWMFETDRSRFIGRGHTLADPRGATEPPGKNEGFVLDPILSLRLGIDVEPGKRIVCAMIVAAGDNREEVLATARKYQDLQVIDRAMDFAWRSSQIELRQLHILPDEARRFQQLADHLLFPNNLLRASAESLARNRKGQSGLWPYSISGDLPIVLVSIDDVRDIGLVRQLLQAQTYLRRRGLTADLVILNEEDDSYTQPLRERLISLIQAHSMFIGRDQPSGVYLRSAGQMPDEDLRLLRAAANVSLVAARGSLSQQLGTPRSVPEWPPPLKPEREPVAGPPPPLPESKVSFHNGFGGFSADGREYVIELTPGVQTPAPWVNVMANPRFGALASETGAGFCWYGNSQRNRVNAWSNDAVVDPPSEAIYIRDDASGEYWTPTAAPVRNRDPYRCRHGAGYSIFEHNHAGTESELVLFVPVDDANSPVKVQKLTLRNRTREPRQFSITWYTELTLGEHRETSQMHIVTHWDSESRTLLARNAYHPDYGERVTFFAMTPKPTGYCGDRTGLLGRNRTLKNPEALERASLGSRAGAGLDPCAALQTVIELAPEEAEEIICVTGQARSVEEARLLARTFRDHAKVEAALRQTREWWDRLLGSIEIETPEPGVDILVNRWLLYQSLSCRIWGRSAFYQSGGAFGYRDQLQDVLAFLFSRPEFAREQILLAAGRQFREGDVQHWWHPPGGAGIRSRISDDLLWLPYVTSRYVRATGDIDILRADVPFLSAPELDPDQHELFIIPDISDERGSIYEHCRRAVERGLTSGPNGLPLIGTGDWNDGLNLVGAKGRGESVWLAWFLVDILDGMADLAARLDRPDEVQDYRTKRADLMERIERNAWDGEWYLRGTFDDGTLLGSHRCQEARIDSLPQSWAWLTGAGDPKRAEVALESAWDRLVLEDEGLVLLFEPPFDQSSQNPGYIKGYPPGVRENGGQYTHAALWFAMAMARRGDGVRAVEMLKMMSPLEHSRDKTAAARYGLEPYAVAADIYRLPGRVGKGGWSWYTGSAAWTWRAWVEEVLGLRRVGDHLEIRPSIPSSWPGYRVTYRYGQAIYHIRVENPDAGQNSVVKVLLDGHELPDRAVPLDPESGERQVLVMMGAS